MIFSDVCLSEYFSLTPCDRIISSDSMFKHTHQHVCRRLLSLSQPLLKAATPPTHHQNISSTLSQCRAPSDYLKQCQLSESSHTSTVFRGTLYEIHTMSVFERLFNCRNLVNVGGAYDNGLDLIGSWNLIPFWERVKNDLPNPKYFRGLLISRLVEYQESIGEDARVQTPRLSLASDVNVLVQCKNSLHKIGATIVRELSGIYHFHMKKKSQHMKTFMFLASPLPMTSQALALMEGFKFPAGHLRLDPLMHKPMTAPYDIKNYLDGLPRQVYFNTEARKALKGLSVELFLKASIQSQ